MANRLAKESSPYLVQHKDQPVDWYPWGKEAFAQAQADKKPIFVSIGYAACHWCHVMAHESFENLDIAELLNQFFVSIKVDREERPDVDTVYMNAIHVMGESGGWPLSAFCDSEGRPYFLGTYFPPVSRGGRPGFPEVVRTLAAVFREQPEEVAYNSEALLAGLRRSEDHWRQGAAQNEGQELETGLIRSAAHLLVQATDLQYGGFGGRPKFPSSPVHELLGRAGRFRFGEGARTAFLLQAEKMARGGIYDQLGGGFARYSVDEGWRVPHFEKMLYDNGQLLAIYADAWAMSEQRSQKNLFAQVLEQSVDWLEREMSDPAGGLWASLDADSEGEEGKYYVWTPEQIEQALGPEDALLWCQAYGVKESGNFVGPTSVLARVGERGSDRDERALAAMRKKLATARAARVRPATDDKVLTSWNALTVSALLRVWCATANERAQALAMRVAQFLVEKMLSRDGLRIARVYKDGVTKLEGTLEDYALAAEAFFNLAEARGDALWWRRGELLAQSILRRFYAEREGVGVFYWTACDSEDPLIHRPEANQDGAMPSAAAVALALLLRLGLVSGDPQALAVARSYLAKRAFYAKDTPFRAARLLSALDFYLHGEILVVTEGAGQDSLLAAARAAYAPALAIAGSWASTEITANKHPKEGRAQAYLCRGTTCQLPVSCPAELTELLRSRTD